MAPARVSAHAYLPPSGPPLAVVTARHGEELPIHEHEFDELVIVLSGHGRHRTRHADGGDEHDLATGDVAFIPGGVAHGYQDVRGLRLINVLSDPQRLELPRQDLAGLPGWQILQRLEPQRRARGRHDHPCIRLPPGPLRRVQARAQDLHRLLTTATPGHRFQALACYMDLLLMVVRQGRIDAQALTARIAQVLTAIESAPQEAWTIAGLARHAGLSPRHFQRLFRDGVGCTPLAYILERRIERAQELLRQSADPVTSIAFATGFNDSNYFSRQFRRLVGCSPTHWRRAQEWQQPPNRPCSAVCR
ncbi:MAG: helix-turn-helix domain-containing protein [Planctomycetota bacterium]